MRDYLSIKEASKIIASEVIETGASDGWSPVNENNLSLARDLEKHLAKFNIGYTNPRAGSWTPRRDGTRYFSTMKLVGLAKVKLGSLLSTLKK